MNNNTMIKFCGIKRIEDAQFITRLYNEYEKPNYAGFIFWEKSQRYVTKEQAMEIGKALPEIVKKVGVFLDEKVETVIDTLKSYVIDIAQLHGDESYDYIHKVKISTDKPVIKAYHISNMEEVMVANNSPADYILLDASVPGKGVTTDWEILKYIQRPYFLAGGLNPDNVKDAVDMLEPYAVDVSSGIETDKVKDFVKMQQFILASITNK